MKPFQYVVNCILAVFVTVGGVVTSSQAQIKIMPLGDSITYGVGSSGLMQVAGGYRNDLAALLDDAGISYDFVGTLKTGQGFDADHEGHGGWRADQIEMEIGTYLRAAQPDIVLLHIGTNDVTQSESNTNIITEIEGIVNEIHFFNGAIKIVVSSLVPRTDLKNETTNKLNTLIEALVQQKYNNEGFKIVFVDNNKAFKANPNWASEYMRDSMHPNDSGYRVMAEEFFKAIPGGGEPVNLTLSKLAMVRYNLNGSLDGDFDGDGKVITDFPKSVSESVHGMAIQDDGKIVTVGVADSQFAVARYYDDGSLDDSFHNDGRVTTVFSGFEAKALAVAIQADGKIVAAGQAKNTSNGDYQFAVARYNPDGSLDDTFDRDGKVLTNFFTNTELEGAQAVAILANGKIVVVGEAYSGGSQFALLRYNANGSLDGTFDSDGRVLTDFGPFTNESAYAMAIQNDGKIVAAGGARFDGGELFAVARYYSNGRLDATFDSDGKVLTDFFSGPSESINDIAIQADGKIVAAGSASANGTGNQFQFALARYNTNGSLDSKFDGDGRLLTNFTNSSSESINDVAIQPDGRIVAAGFAYVNSHFQFAVARYNPNGKLDTSFDGDGKLLTNLFATDEEFANALTIQSDGKIIAAGMGVKYAVGKKAVDDEREVIMPPETCSLFQNYPNPFNPTTSIQFVLKEAGWTTLKIYNDIGQKIATLSDGHLEAGQHTFNFDATGLASGVYFYQVSVNGFRATKKMQLVK